MQSDAFGIIGNSKTPDRCEKFKPIASIFKIRWQELEVSNSFFSIFRGMVIGYGKDRGRTSIFF